MNGSARTQRIVAVGVLGFVLFNYPLLALFDQETMVLGVPLLWAYLFVAWALLIAAIAVLVGRSR
jgi:hypothetical protein